MKTIIFILLLFFGYSAALACSCIVPDDKQKSDALKNSSVVFRGKVVSANAASDQINVRFSILTAWKGTLSNEIVVSTPPDSAACGYNFETGATYTVYASGNPPATNSCTMLLVDEKRIREVLGEGKSSATAPQPQSKPTGNVWTRFWRKVSSIFS